MQVSLVGAGIVSILQSAAVRKRKVGSATTAVGS